MNVYCEVCHGEMEIMRDLGTELHVYPCGCSGKQASRPTPLALDGAIQPPDFQQVLPADVLVGEGALPEPPRQ